MYKLKITISLIAFFFSSTSLADTNQKLEKTQEIKILSAINKHSKEFNQIKTISFIDYSKKIDEKRFFVVSVKDMNIIYSTFVGHAYKSGKSRPTSFSNKKNSRMTSLGLYRIKKKYKSLVFEHSYRLSGLESDNSNALSRGIVIHEQGGSGIVINNNTNKFLNLWTDGCFSFFPEDFKYLQNIFKEGHLLLVVR